ncbi:MAG: hypothetical protein IJF83_10785 [Methanobrevibacter sp.]|nr:hypothetical protein [Methanobrevibacter sp.]
MKLEEFCNDKNLSINTQNLYTSSVRLYEQINDLSLDFLIEEADKEEEKGIRWKHRKLKDRLIQYRNYLFANKSQGTANRYLGCIKTIYRHFEIELQPLPSFNSKQIDLTYQMDYDDLVTKQEIIDAYYEANNEMKNIIVFAISTGLSKVDMLKLKVFDFFEACDVKYKNKEVIDVLYDIKAKDNLIPCFKGTRKKTGVKYITFCSPEAVEHIVQRLIGRDAKLREEGLRLSFNDKLFNISNSHLLYSFKKINNKLNLGKVGKFSKMRCHMLRKYHASTLLNCEEIKWSKEEIDTLQGRLQDMTHRAYFHVSIEKIYKKYMASVDELMLFKSINGVDEEAFEKLKTENNFYKKEIVKNENKLVEQQKTINKILENQRELEALLGL